ncbi:MAG: hypothetical protein AAF404_06880 [Pseudomonadota bacterium]
MDTKHRFIVGGLFLLHGLARIGLGFLILPVNIEMNFSETMIIVAMGVPSVLGGYNLLTGKPQAHAILCIAALVNLFDFIAGTALAIYYYWYWRYQCGAPHPFKTSTRQTSVA